MKHLILILTAILLFASCSNKEKEADLQVMITELENQLDECQNGASKIHAKAKLAFDENDFRACKEYYTEIKDKYPDSELLAEVKTIYDKIIQEEKEASKRYSLLLEKRKQGQLKALKKLKKSHDDVSGTTWYKQPYFTHYNNSNLTSIYIGKNGDYSWLRLIMSYEGENWIFFDNAYLSYDGKTIEIPFNKYNDKETENSGGKVWEWIDLTVTKDVEMFLREFAKSKNAKMRLSGKYTETRTLTYNERRGILDVLKGYDALK